MPFDWNQWLESDHWTKVAHTTPEWQDYYWVSDRCITDLPRTITTLNLDYSMVVDDQLQLLRRFPRLRLLSLSGALITGRGLRYLSGLTMLTGLSLSTCGKLSDRGMRQIQHLTHLTDLDIGWNDQITDVTLGFVAKLPSLRRLSVERSLSITPGGVAMLRNALPNVCVRFEE